MKKIFFILATILLAGTQAFAQTDFTRALTNCDKYSQDGSIPYKGQVFNLKISLEKSKNKCVYKERIYQDIGYEELVCNFDKNQLPTIVSYMETYSDTYKKELAQNRIFEAKLSSNGDVFQRYLVEPKICTINHSTKKK